MAHYCVLYLKGGELVDKEHNVPFNEFLYVLSCSLVPWLPPCKKKDGEVKKGEPGHIFLTFIELYIH